MEKDKYPKYIIRVEFSVWVFLPVIAPCNLVIVKSKQQPWTIILLVYVGSIVDLIGLTNTNDKRSRDRYNVELTFKP